MTRILLVGRGARDKTTLAVDRQVKVAFMVAVMSLFGCKKDEPTQRFECDCAFLTDFDDASSQRVEVCATDSSKAEEVARGCAQTAAPAPIQSCTCSASSDTEASKSGASKSGTCKPGECKVKAER